MISKEGQKINLVMDKVFQEQTGKTESIFQLYKKIYNLPTIVFEAKVSEKLYDYVLRRDKFILLLIYDSDGNVFLTRNVADTLYWGLPGGSIKNNETIQEAINRIAKDVYPHLVVGDVEPVAYIENKFTYKKQTFNHHGLSFVGRVRNKSMIKVDELLGSFIKVNEEEMKYIKRLASQNVVEIFNKRFTEIQQRTGKDFQEDEISINEKFKKRYVFHNKFVKRFILTNLRKRKEEFAKIIASLIGKDIQSIIDISCGEDSFIFTLGKELQIPIIVGNDISWSQIELLNQTHREVIFTNHNAASLPFVKDAFDISYCSNTLHHMPNRKALVNLLESMFYVSKKMILVEIEDTKEVGGIPHFLHKRLFVGYLKDVGGAYLTEDDFQIIVNEVFESKAKIEFQTFRNIMGKYLIATITKNEEAMKERIELEKKFFLRNKEQLMEIIRQENFNIVEKTQELDEYFTDIHSVFIKNRVCLRIRRTNDTYMELTFKGKSSEFGNFYAKTENNLTVPINEYERVLHFFSSLGYQSYVVVKKYREVYSIKEDSIHYSIMIDDIEEVGTFVEIEVLGKKDVHNVDYLTKELNKLVEKFSSINLENANMPYRDFVAKEIYNKMKIPVGLKALLIDLDGTLINSEPVFFETYKNVLLDDYGVNISCEDYENNEMAQNSNLISYLKQNGKLNRDISESEIMEKVYARYEAGFINLIGNSETLLNFELLKMLKTQTNIKLALVTTSKEHYVNILLDKLDIRNLFDVVIVRESVEKLKPEPDAYIKAMKLLQLTETEALALEDSKRGIQAAKNAFLPVVGINKVKKECSNEYYLDTFARFALIFMNHFKK